MSKRPLNRKVTVVFENRDPNDSANLLRSIEATFRPRDLEIRVTDKSRPDEQLETRVSEHVSQLLDEKDRETEPVPVAATPEVAASMCRRTVTWFQLLFAGGWRIGLRVLTVAERAEKVYVKFKDLVQGEGSDVP